MRTDLEGDQSHPYRQICKDLSEVLNAAADKQSFLEAQTTSRWTLDDIIDLVTLAQMGEKLGAIAEQLGTDTKSISRKLNAMVKSKGATRQKEPDPKPRESKPITPKQTSKKTLVGTKSSKAKTAKRPAVKPDIPSSIQAIQENPELSGNFKAIAEDLIQANQTNANAQKLEAAVLDFFTQFADPNLSLEHVIASSILPKHLLEKVAAALDFEIPDMQDLQSIAHLMDIQDQSDVALLRTATGLEDDEIISASSAKLTILEKRLERMRNIRAANNANRSNLVQALHIARTTNPEDPQQLKKAEETFAEMGINVSKSWPGTRILQILKLYDQGLSAAEIGCKLKTTRNAIVGKIHRIANGAEDNNSYDDQSPQAA